MRGYPIFLLIAILAVFIPFLSAGVWFYLYNILLPGFSKVVKKMLFINNKEAWKRNVAVSFAQLMFHLSLMITIPASILLEFLVLLPLVLAIGIESGVTQTLTVASAGPIEEIMKLVSAIAIYFIIFHTHGRLRQGYDKVKVGIVAGIFAGAVFGLVESIGYLTIAVEELILNGATLQYMDAFVWRVILGVAIHASFTGLASGGIGRKGWSWKVKITAVLLLLAIFFHTFNNAIQGYVFLILEMNDATAYLIVDVIQGILAVANLALLSLVWRGIIFKKGEDSDYQSGMYRSQMIYSPRGN